MSELGFANQHNGEEHVLLVVNVDGEYTKDVLTAAEANGASGFTAVHGKSMHVKAKEAVFNVPIGTRRSLVLIVAKKEAANKTQSDIFEAVGLKTKARGLVFQLPICALSGFGSAGGYKDASPEPCGDGGYS